MRLTELYQIGKNASSCGWEAKAPPGSLWSAGSLWIHLGHRAVTTQHQPWCSQVMRRVQSCGSSKPALKLGTAPCQAQEEKPRAEYSPVCSLYSALLFPVLLG